MDDFRFKVVRADGSHYFYTPMVFYTLRDALYTGFYMAHKEGVKDVDLYNGTKLIATFYH